jgi:hypothetical protein
MSGSHRQLESSGRGCEDAAVEKVEVARGDKTDAWVVQVMHSVEGVILAAAIRLLPRSRSRGVRPAFDERTTASAAMTGCKQQIRGRLAVVSQLTDGSIAPEVAFVKARRNWPNLWMATTRDWLSLDDRIKELGSQRARGQRLSTDVLIHLAARSIGQAT